MGLHDFFWNFHPFSSKMGNFFSAIILGVEGEIWVTNRHNTKGQNTIQKKNYKFSKKNLLYYQG